jgi:WD40 repeat protein
MAAAAAAELVAVAAPMSAAPSASKQHVAHANLNSIVADLEGRIGRCAVLSLAFNPAGSLLVASTADWRIAGWALVAQAAPSSAAAPFLIPAFELSGAHTGAIHSIGVLGDGTVLYTSGSDSLIRLWQTSRLLPAAPGMTAVESETSPGAHHPASITMVSSTVQGKP